MHTIFFERFGIRYENASSEFESMQKMSRKKVVPENVYEENQFPRKMLPTLRIIYTWDEFWWGMYHYRKLRQMFLDEKNIKVRHRVIRKTLMRLGYRCGRQKSLRWSQGNTYCHSVLNWREFSWTRWDTRCLSSDSSSSPKTATWSTPVMSYGQDL